VFVCHVSLSGEEGGGKGWPCASSRPTAAVNAIVAASDSTSDKSLSDRALSCTISMDASGTFDVIDTVNRPHGVDFCRNNI
jgi:hypothetical protein